MAKAIIRAGLDRMKTIKLAHSAAVADGDVITSGGQILVASNDYDADELGVYVAGGPVEFPKEAALAIAIGDTCYFDTTAGEVDKTNTNVKVGLPIEAAEAADSVVLIDLQGNLD